MAEKNITAIQGRMNLNSPIMFEKLINRTMSSSTNTSDYKLISERSDNPLDLAIGQKISTVTSSLTSLSVTASTTTDAHVVPQNSDSTTIAKITALLVITAIVLVISYRFVVRLFLGYTDRKDDVLPDGLSDEEEDSAVVKRVPEHTIEIRYS